MDEGQGGADPPAHLMSPVPAGRLRAGLLAWADEADPWAAGEFPAWAAWAGAWRRLGAEIAPTDEIFFVPTEVQADLWRLLHR